MVKVPAACGTALKDTSFRINSVCTPLTCPQLMNLIVVALAFAVNTKLYAVFLR